LKMVLTILASGSSGNCALVQGDGVCLVIDAGLPIRTLQKRLGRAGRKGPVVGVLLTHAHADHIGHAAAYSDYFGCPILISTEALAALPEAQRKKSARCLVFDAGEAFGVGAFRIWTCPTPHSEGSVAYLVSGNGRALGWISDCGSVTNELMELAQGVSVLAVESNYSPSVLAQCTEYDQRLRQRISGGRGHLSNEQASQLIAAGASSGNLRKAILMHLSEHSNFPELAMDTAMIAKGNAEVEILIAGRDGAESVEV